MKNLIKKLLVLTISFVLIFTVIGCNNNEDVNTGKVDFSKAVEIFEGDEVTAKILTAGEFVVYKFVPTETKQYFFCSSGPHNTWGLLYNDKESLIYSNDDSGLEENFFISYKLTKNKTYYLAVHFVDVLKTGSFKVEVGSQEIEEETSKDSKSEQSTSSKPSSTSNQPTSNTTSSNQQEVSQSASSSQVVVQPELNVIKMAFGSYPQTKVTDSTVISTLNYLAGDLPTASNSANWTVYDDYYISSTVTEFMWYIDVECLGTKYRGVYFNQYRPFWVADESTEDRSYQDDNGYLKNTIHWFKYEPLVWHILSVENNKLLLVCENIVDCRQFDYSLSPTNHFGQSAIRTWLNESFYNTAFSSAEKEKVVKSTISNNERNSNPFENAMQWNGGVNVNAGPDTEDNVFLLSMLEVTNPNYGFMGYNKADDMRKKIVTDYGKCQGSVIGDDGFGYWWTRSPRSLIDMHALVVYNNGGAHEGCSVYNTAFGVVPAIYVNLN